MKRVCTNIEGNRANLVQTAWALLSLIDAGLLGASFSIQIFNHLLCIITYHCCIKRPKNVEKKYEKKNWDLHKWSQENLKLKYSIVSNFGNYTHTLMLILNVFTTLGRDRPNTNSSRSKSTDQFTNGRWRLPSTGNSCLLIQNPTHLVKLTKFSSSLVH